MNVRRHTLVTCDDFAGINSYFLHSSACSNGLCKLIDTFPRCYFEKKPVGLPRTRSSGDGSRRLQLSLERQAFSHFFCESNLYPPELLLFSWPLSIVTFLWSLCLLPPTNQRNTYQRLHWIRPRGHRVMLSRTQQLTWYN